MFTNRATAERYDNEGLAEADYFAGSLPNAGEYDFCSRDGANALKAKIEAYWRERGASVQVMLHNVGFHPAIRAARFDVRSDMVNGMPRNASAKGRPAAPVDACIEDFDNEDDDLVFE